MMENRNKNKQTQTASATIVGCVRASKLIKGCVVMMRAESGLIGYGNPQCVSSVCEPLDEISLYGHNQSYKTWDIQKIIEYPFIEQKASEYLPSGNRDVLQLALEALHEIYEEYAGMEGFVAKTAPEGYLQKLVYKMAKIAKDAENQIRKLQDV